MRSEIRDEVLTGIATILWGDAWASHVEDHGCYDLSGCSIEDHMPEIPWRAWLAAGRLLHAVEKAHTAKIEDIYARALEADMNNGRAGRIPGNRRGPERFGHCIAWESMGAGVGWTDDHAPIPFYKTPYMGFDLWGYAASTCEEEVETEEEPDSLPAWQR